MKEFRCVWVACPTSHNQRAVVFVEAENVDDAKLICKDHIRRSTGIASFIVESVAEEKPLPKGRVVK